jgi:hypothetical protein
MISSIHLVVPAVAIVLLNIGCGRDRDVADDEPSYADLVVIYNAEMEGLDRLENKKNELIATHEKQLQPSGDDAVKALTDVLSAANEAYRGSDSDEALDPQAALDQAAEKVEKAQEVASQLLESLTQPVETQPVETQPAENGGVQDTVETDPRIEDFNRQLEAIEGEIKKQQARVDRAREARDAAEAE